MSADERRRVDEAVAARKAAVAASLGKTVEELGHSHGHAHGEAHADAAGEHPGKGVQDVPEGEPAVDEEAVLAFIRSRQDVIGRQRSRIKSLEGQVRHLEHQRDLAERKVAALRAALADLRGGRGEA